MSEQRSVRWQDRLYESIPLVVTIGGIVLAGITGYMKLTWTVADLKTDQQAWRSGSEQRRERSHEEIDAIRNRLTVLETLERCREHGGCK